MEKTEQKGIFDRIYNWFNNLTVKGLLGSILISFVIVIILLSLSFIPGIMSRISSSLSAALYSIFIPAENATMTVDNKIINSDENFTVNFKKGGTENGIFTVSYSCDFDIELVSVEANGLRKIDCDKPFYLLENETSVTLRPTTADSVVRLVVDGAFENNDTQKTEQVGVARVTIKNNSAGTVVSLSKDVITKTATNTSENISNSPTYVPPTTQVAYYGKPDLAVRILQTGLLNQGTNLIVNQTQFNYSDLVGIKFEVRNDGDANTGIWNFTATLPSISTPTYSSNAQISLRPGESIVFTLGFSNLTSQEISLITINVDPQNIVSETVEYNNIVTSMIKNLSYNSNYYYNNGSTVNNGCYINGVFTYNCYNNYDYNSNYYNNGWNYNNYYGNNLTVSCYATPANPDTGDRVRWYANAYGGDGDYTYDWTGTNNLDTSTHNPTKTYSSRGWKYATVTVTDGDDNETSATCSVYVD